jgi:hypothetical protein
VKPGAFKLWVNLYSPTLSAMHWGDGVVPEMFSTARHLANLPSGAYTYSLYRLT